MQKIIGNVLYAVYLIDNQVDFILYRGQVFTQFGDDDIEVTEHDCGGIVDFVRDTGGEFAQCRELFGDHQFLPGLA